jgi:hypothetical protein
VAAFCDELMLCAAVAAVGPARSSWWAVWDRREATLHERARTAPGPALARFDDGGRLRVRDRGVRIDLVVDEGRRRVARAGEAAARARQETRDPVRKHRPQRPARASVTSFVGRRD